MSTPPSLVGFYFIWDTLSPFYRGNTTYHQARETNETRPYEEAAERDANRRDLLAKLDIIRPVLENWPQVRDARRASLETLNGHIATMKTRQVLLDIHTGEIIHAFRRFHDGMSDYFSLLDTMVETIDLERIDWLLLTPEQRIEQHRQETIRNELLRRGVISAHNQLPINLDDPASFDAAAIQLYENWINSLREEAPLTDEEANELAYMRFSDIDRRATVETDPLRTEEFWENVSKAAEVVFFVAGFIPVVGQILDATDVIAAIARGDIIGAAVMLALPEGAEVVLRSLGRGMRRLADKAEELLRRMGDDLIEDIARQTGKSADEIREMIGLARGRSDDMDAIENRILRADSGDMDNVTQDSRSGNQNESDKNSSPNNEGRINSENDSDEIIDDEDQVPDIQGFSDNENTIRHIFRDEDGHFPEDTPANREEILDLAQNKNNYLGSDSYGNHWFAETREDGKQIWVRTRDGIITNAGINDSPKTFNPQTGLNAPPGR